MSQTIDVNGQSINYPETGDTNWGDEATDFAVQTSAAFGKLGLASGTSVDIAQTLDVTGNTTLDANLSVAGTTSLTGNVTLTNNLTVNGNTSLGDASGDSLTINSLDVTGNALISGTLGVTGNTTISGTLGISNGTVSSPSLTPSSDTNTGLYSIGADKIGFAANGSRVGEFGDGYGGFTGNIIQVTSGVLTTRATTSSSSFVDTGLSASITPRYSTSKILILFSGSFNNTTAIARFNLVRNSINIAQGTGGSVNSTGNYYNNTSSGYDYALSQTSVNFLDGPSTTSTITYKIQFASSLSGVNIAMNGRLVANDYVGISTIVLMEVQQ